MTHEVRLSRVDRRQATLHSFPAPRVRIRIITRAARDMLADADDDKTIHSEENDDLRAARGILFASLLGIGLWALIGLVFWFIAR